MMRNSIVVMAKCKRNMLMDRVKYPDYLKLFFEECFHSCTPFDVKQDIFL